MEPKSIDELTIGEKASFTKTISESDVYQFAGISGDLNPLHTDEEYARETPFGTRIVHGSLTAALMGGVLGMKLPGLGTVAYDSSIRFRHPVHFGDTITATAEVAEKNEEKNIVTFRCTWTNQRGTVVAEGSARVLPPRK